MKTLDRVSLHFLREHGYCLIDYDKKVYLVKLLNQNPCYFVRFKRDGSFSDRSLYFQSVNIALKEYNKLGEEIWAS